MGRLDTAAPDHVINGVAWDTVADALERADTDARPSREGFNWMQFRGHGPGEELFGPLDGASVLEVGCGGGDALAFLAGRGAAGIGVDASERQLMRARSRWSGSLGGRVRFIHGDAAAVLASIAPGGIDLAYSVFGAIGYADPCRLLPAVHRVLRARGRLLFAVRHPLWPYPSEEPLEPLATGPPQARCLVRLELTSGNRSTVVHYRYPVEGWRSLCHEAGFEVDDVRELWVPPASLDRWYGGGELEAMAEAARRFPCTLLLCATKLA